MADIFNYNSKGGKIRVPQRKTDISAAQNPQPNRKRLSQAGTHVKGAVVTNPSATGPGSRKRTKSLGMGGVGSRGRSSDF